MHWYLAALKKYADFSGRARRKEFWLYTLINLVIMFGLVYIEALAEESEVYLGDGIVSGAYLVLSFIPSFAVQVRRLHDTDHSGRWFLIPLVPLIGWFVLFMLLVRGGTPGPNRFGPDPRSSKTSKPVFDPEFA